MALSSEAGTSGAGTPDLRNEGLFVRQSSGLVREMGLRDAFYFASNFASLPGNVALGLFAVLALFPGSDPALTAIVVGVQCVFVALVYSFLVGAMPRSGGDYVYLGRAVRPVLGAAMGIAILLLTGLTIAQIVYSIVQLYLPPAITLVGHAFGGNWSSSASDVGTTHVGEIIAGSLLVGLAAAACLAGNAVARRALFWGFWLGLVGTLIILYEALTHSTASFATAFNAAAHNPHAYQQVIAAGRSAHVQFGITLSGVFHAAPLLALFFAGFAYSNFAAGELKRPSRTYRISVISAITLFTVGFAGCWWALEHMAGSSFLHSAAVLSSNEPATYAKIAGGAGSSTQYFASVVAGNGFTQAVPSVTYAIGYGTLIVAELFIFSRLAFAMAFDRLLPTRLADVSAKRRAPLKAVAVGVALSMVFLILAIFTTTFLSLLRNLSLIYLTQVTVASLVATFLPWLKPDLYAASPKLFSGRWFGIPSITVIGAISAATNALFLYFAATQTQVSGGYNTNTIVTLAVVGLSGFVVYGISRYLLARRGVDLALAMHELPPE